MTLPLWCGSLEAFEVWDIGLSQPPEPAVTYRKKVRSPAPCFVFFSFPWQGSEEADKSFMTLN